MNVIETMKQALEALELVDEGAYSKVTYNLRAAIEQMEKAEPVGYLLKALPIFQERLLPEQNPDKWTALYTAPVAPEYKP